MAGPFSAITRNAHPGQPHAVTATYTSNGGWSTTYYHGTARDAEGHAADLNRSAGVTATVHHDMGASGASGGNYGGNANEG